MKSSKSFNLWITLIGFLSGLSMLAFGIEIKVAPETIVETFASKDVMAILSMAVLYLLTPAYKIFRVISAAGFTWKVFLSRNIIAHTISAISLIAALYFGEVTAGVITMVITQLANFLLHKLVPETKVGAEIHKMVALKKAA